MFCVHYNQTIDYERHDRSSIYRHTNKFIVCFLFCFIQCHKTLKNIFSSLSQEYKLQNAWWAASVMEDVNSSQSGARPHCHFIGVCSGLLPVLGYLHRVSKIRPVQCSSGIHQRNTWPVWQVTEVASLAPSRAPEPSFREWPAYPMDPWDFKLCQSQYKAPVPYVRPNYLWGPEDVGSSQSGTSAWYHNLGVHPGYIFGSQLTTQWLWTMPSPASKYSPSRECLASFTCHRGTEPYPTQRPRAIH